MFVFSRATAGLLLVTLSIALAGAAQQATPIQIGMTKSFFHERSKVVVEIVGDDFAIDW